MATVTTRTIGTLRLETLEAGQGGRPLLLTHGFTGAKEDFGDWMDAFADQGWWVVAPDQRGHGASDQPPEESDYSLALMASDLLGLADQLGWDRFSLLGHSMGGMVVQEVALGHPDRIERLVLMATSDRNIEALDPETVALGVAVLRSEGLPALLALIATLPAAEKAPSELRVRAERPGYVEWSDGKVEQCSAAMYASMATEMAHRADRLPELVQLPMPTLVVVGDEDKLMLGSSLRMAEAIPVAELVVIPDASHCPQFENPQPWWEAVSTFLSADRLID